MSKTWTDKEYKPEHHNFSVAVIQLVLYILLFATLDLYPREWKELVSLIGSQQ